MTLLLSSSITPIPPVISLASSSSPSLAFSANPSYRLGSGFLSLNSKLFNGIQTHTPLIAKERSSLILKATTNVDELSSDTPEASSGSEDEFENLSLDSKLQLKLEHKMRMKFGKKTRLRRKKLVRKRGLRKKGSWPPSKMKKNRNV